MALPTAPSPDDGADFAAVKALFLEVCDLADESAIRAQLQARQTQPLLIERVLALVREEASNSTRFSGPVAGMAAAAARPELSSGATLGPWRLISELGQGGMGQVFLAERSDGHYEQRAAIKLLLGWTGPGAMEQLARERQILASLNHPNIARLLDGGTTPAGRPYLVMDLVEGVALDAYVAAQRPDFNALLDLMGMVLDAVAYAHRQLVVHCDIKPGNVLVAPDGRAQLLDFGIAQLQHKGSQETPHALTPRYASPEQRAGHAGQPASDIYSLGVVLGELLAITPGAAGRAPEWQAIVARACAEDPAARYSSVEALQADLRRLRSHLPVQALAGDWRYRFRKGLRRQWPWVLVGSGAIALSLGFTWQLMQERDRALQAEARARQETVAAEEVTKLLVDLFEGADPARNGRPDVSAASLVDRGRDQVAQGLNKQPELQARMFAVLGQVYAHMGQPRNAIAMHQRTAELHQQLGNQLAEASALRSMAASLTEAYQSSKAVDPARRALALRRAAGAPPALQAQALATLGGALVATGAFSEAEAALQEALEIRRSEHGAEHRDVALVLHLQGVLARQQGQFDRAQQLFLQALTLRRQLLGPRHLDSLGSQQLLGITLSSLGRVSEAENLLRELIDLRVQVQGANSQHVGTAWNELAYALQDDGRTAEAVAAYRQNVAVTERLAGRPSAGLAVSLNNLASALEDLGDPAAQGLYRDALEQRQAVLPAGDLAIARGQVNLGRWLLRHGQPAQGQRLLQQGLDTRLTRLPAGHDEILGSQGSLAECETALGHLPAAESLLDSAAAHRATMRPLRKIALMRAQAQLLKARGETAAAAQLWRQIVTTAEPLWRDKHPNLLRLRLEAAQAWLQAGQPVQAQLQLQKAQPLLTEQHPQSPLRTLARSLQARTTPSIAGVEPLS